MKIKFLHNANDLYFLQNKQKVFEQDNEILENYNFIVENLNNEIELIENKNGVCTVSKYIGKKQYFFNENLFLSEDNEKEEVEEIEENKKNYNNIDIVKHKTYLKNNVKNIFVFVFVLSLI
jgi:hypothetical protein